MPPEADELTRLRRKLRDTRADLREARAELARRPAETGMEDLAAEEIGHLYAQFEPPTGNSCAQCGKIHPGPCQTCGGLHARECPRVRSVEFTMQGDRVLIRKVTYWHDWDDSGIIFADQLPPLPEEA